MVTGSKIFTGVFWSMIQTIVNRSFSFLIKLFLARILFPEDYGLVGMAAVFISFITVFNDLGMGAALVQKKEVELSEDHYHTVFWTGVVFSIFIYLIVSFGIGNFAAWFYEERILKNLIPVLGLGILASPLNIVPQVQLNRALDFKKIALINNSSNILSGLLALLLAILGAGVWSLVFNSVFSILIAIPFYYLSTGWRPSLIWDKKCFKDIFGFGVITTGTGLVNKIKNQIDYILIGKLIGAGSLGIYSFAFIITATFRSHITGIMSQVMYPVYSELQDRPRAMVNYFLKLIKFNAYIVYPIMVYFILFSQYFIPFFFGDKWNEAIGIIKIVSVSVLFHLLVNSETDLIRARGNPSLELKMQIFKAVIFVPCIALGTFYYGIYGTAIGYLIAKILDVSISVVVLNRLFEIKPGTLILTVFVPVLASAISGFSAFLMDKSLNFHWLLTSLIYLLIYIAITLIYGREDIQLIKNIVKRRIKNKEIARV